MSDAVGYMVYDERGNAVNWFEDRRDADELAVRYPDLVVIAYDDDGLVVSSEESPEQEV